MNHEGRIPFFSVIIATRDRPNVFMNAFQSVLRQTCPSKEILIVNDSSSEGALSAYENAVNKVAIANASVRFISLTHNSDGHGQSYALNVGVSKAKGNYICFLDDDDIWTDEDHLTRVHSNVRDAESSGERIDLLLGNQKAFLQGAEVNDPIWLEPLESRLLSDQRVADAHGGFRVTVSDLLSVNGFCHLNALIVHRELFMEIGGMDANIRWECDHDLYLRLIDQAHHMVHLPHFISRHNIPDVSKRENLTTSFSMLEKWLFQLRVFDKAALFARHPQIRAYGRRYKAYTVKKIAEHLYAAGRFNDAAYYARQGLGARANLKWFLFTIYLQLLAILRRSLRPAVEKPGEG